MTALARSIGRLHVLTDETVQQRFDHVQLARMAAIGGADVVQLREKRSRGEDELVAIAVAMLEVLEPFGAMLIIDDRVQVALRARAHGVHLGRSDLEPAAARRRLGDGYVIGGTANDEEEALRVGAGPVDYLGVGPVFGTRSKLRPAPELGVERLRAIARATPRPVIAIGNVTAERVGRVVEAGVHGIAVLSAVVTADDPVAATAALRAALDAETRP